MRVTVVISCLGWGLFCSGCALMQDAGKNLILSVARPMEEARECARNRRWAREAWRSAAKNGTYTADYAAGFEDGFAEFLYKGGNGEPPLVAPGRYRTLAYQSPQGHAAVEDWFTGYRYGATVARDSGLRQWVTGPSALQLTPLDGNSLDADQGPPWDSRTLPMPSEVGGGPKTPERKMPLGLPVPAPQVDSQADEALPKPMPDTTPVPFSTAPQQGPATKSDLPVPSRRARLQVEEAPLMQDEAPILISAPPESELPELPVESGHETPRPVPTMLPAQLGLPD